MSVSSNNLRARPTLACDGNVKGHSRGLDASSFAWRQRKMGLVGVYWRVLKMVVLKMVVWLPMDEMV